MLCEKGIQRFKDLISLATTKFYFIFYNVLCKQIDRIAMGSLVRSSLVNAFLAYHEQDWLERCSFEYRPLYYRTVCL